MLEVQGIQIEKLPFEDLELIEELLSFQGEPLLLHYKSGIDDILAYWIDFDEKNNRWLYVKIIKRELFTYLSGGKTLRELLLEIQSQYLFLVDFGSDNSVLKVVMINCFSLSEKYLPKENSYYIFGITQFYEQYLESFVYLDRLRQKAFIIKVEPSNKIHQNAVGAKEAALVLSGYAKSMENYVDVTAFNMYVADRQTGDRYKINKRVNAIKRKLSPVITEAAYGSFEVWLSMDVVSLDTESNAETEWRNTLIESYKNDVLDLDITSHEDADLIAEKYTPEQRKKIYEPILKILENEDISISISNYSRTFTKDYSTKRITQEFKNIVIPKPTVDELMALQDTQDRIVTAIIRLKGGVDVNVARAKELKQSILFTEETVATYPIESVEINNKVIVFRKPIRCDLSIANNGDFILSNSEFDLYTQKREMVDAVEDLKNQICNLIIYMRAQPEFPSEEKYVILRSIL